MVLGIFVLGTVAWKAAEEYYLYEGRFQIRDKTGNIRGGLTYNANTNMGYFYLGGTGESRTDGFVMTKPDVMIGYSESGNPNIYIFNKYGKVIWQAIK